MARGRVTVRVLNLEPLIKKMVLKEDMRAVGEKVIDDQAARIARGEGSRGRRMRRYTRRYREQLEREGRQSSIRTLRRTGHMLNSRGIAFVSHKQVRVGWTAKDRYFFINQKYTPFVKPTKAEREDLSKFVDERVRARLRKNLAEARANMRGL